MGWVGTVLLQAFLSVAVLGACKRAGWITVHPTRVTNKQARKVFETAIWLGDSITEKTTGAVSELKKLVLPKDKKRLR